MEKKPQYLNFKINKNEQDASAPRVSQEQKHHLDSMVREDGATHHQHTLDAKQSAQAMARFH